VSECNREASIIFTLPTVINILNVTNKFFCCISNLLVSHLLHVEIKLSFNFERVHPAVFNLCVSLSIYSQHNTTGFTIGL
jgi:hypothetical protein